jgi:hypothetical protein
LPCSAIFNPRIVNSRKRVGGGKKLEGKIRTNKEKYVDKKNALL